jgi:transposase
LGRTAVDNRLFINAVLRMLRSEARWHDLPERDHKYKSLYARFMRWARSSARERIFADLVRDKKNFYLMLDSTIVRVHQQVAAGRTKGAPKTRLWGVPEED